MTFQYSFVYVSFTINIKINIILIINNFSPQNFDLINHVEPGREGFFGGSVTLSDYCPYIQEFTWRSKNVIVRGSHCQFEENNPCKFVDIYLYVIIFILLNK